MTMYFFAYDRVFDSAATVLDYHENQKLFDEVDKPIDYRVVQTVKPFKEFLIDFEEQLQFQPSRLDAFFEAA